MANEIPVLLLLFNRPDSARDLVTKLRESAPKKVLIAIDGPRADSGSDHKLIEEVIKIAETINWTNDITYRTRVSNLGLRAAVTDAVTWAMSEHGRAIVLEEDTLPSPDFFEFCNWSLNEFDSTSVGHISGYNVVPSTQLSHNHKVARLTNYPESIAWATWSDKWTSYSDDLDWVINLSIQELAKFCGSTVSALNWKRVFRDARSFRIDTWAYRWIASLWANSLKCLSPNSNLVTYNGYIDGTHTRSKAPWPELPLGSVSLVDVNCENTQVDLGADRWIDRNVFGGSLSGLSKGLLQSAALEARALKRRNDQFSPRGRERFEKNPRR